MSAFGPGDWIEALIDEMKGEPGRVTVVSGRLYCVESVDDNDEALCDDCGDVGVGFFIVGDEPDVAAFSRCHCAFRPIYRPRADLIETLLQPVDGVSPELETA